MTDEEKEPTKNSVFDCSKEHLALLLFMMIYLRDLLIITYNFLLDVGFAPGSGPHIDLGMALRTFFIYNLIPLLLFVLFLSKYGKIRIPKLRPRLVVASTFIIVDTIMIVLILQGGLQARFNFFGYTTLCSSLIIYASTSAFILWTLRDESFIKILLAITLAILTIEELWELPFNLPGVSPINIYHPIMFLLLILRRYMPIFLWFYIFRHAYVTFLKQRWYLILPLASLITVLSIEAATSVLGRSFPVDMPDFYVGPVIRACYAMLLVILPFHFTAKQ